MMHYMIPPHFMNLQPISVHNKFSPLMEEWEEDVEEWEEDVEEVDDACETCDGLSDIEEETWEDVAGDMVDECGPGCEWWDMEHGDDGRKMTLTEICEQVANDWWNREVAVSAWLNNLYISCEARVEDYQPPISPKKTRSGRCY